MARADSRANSPPPPPPPEWLEPPVIPLPPSWPSAQHSQSMVLDTPLGADQEPEALKVTVVITITSPGRNGPWTGRC